jgi:hypothetical protein
MHAHREARKALTAGKHRSSSKIILREQSKWRKNFVWWIVAQLTPYSENLNISKLSKRVKEMSQLSQDAML